ncbi:GNAT family N-acetyltransferase [Streptomyces sp. NPDC051180]|uniref:GNAT family N-acetyltransferase n=1 Tax=Streptomyces sp. NPDC051180 TaxID=3155797 RepID=UPI00344E925B
MDSTVTLRAAATPALPALVLRPWCAEDIPSLIEACQDPVLRHWTSHRVDDEDEGARWLEAQRRGWTTGERFAFAVLEEGPGAQEGTLVGNAVLKEVAGGGRAAEVGYWTAAHARGKGVAPRALEVLTAWAFAAFGGDGLERLDLLHQVDNPASCRVASKSGYALDRVLPAAPPAYPRDGHLHVRHAGDRGRPGRPDS